MQKHLSKKFVGWCRSSLVASGADYRKCPRRTSACYASFYLASRINLDSVRGVVTTMIQTEKYGTPLASALRVLSAEFRNDRMMRAEEKAARLPAIMTVPLILFILPTLFIVILGPAACSIKDNFINH